MDSAALDAFFAKAEDVLSDWRGSDDAMVGRVPASDDVEALPGESYHEHRLLCVVSIAPVGTSPLDHLSRWETVGFIDEAQVLASFARASARASAEFAAFARGMSVVGQRIAEWSHSLPPELWDAAGEPVYLERPVNQFVRAIEARRNRNTGPPDRHGLDGRLRRVRTPGG